MTGQVSSTWRCSIYLLLIPYKLTLNNHIYLTSGTVSLSGERYIENLSDYLLTVLDFCLRWNMGTMTFKVSLFLLELSKCNLTVLKFYPSNSFVFSWEYFSFCFVFHATGGWTQGLSRARQAFYHWTMFPAQNFFKPKNFGTMGNKKDLTHDHDWKCKIMGLFWSELMQVALL